MNSYLLAMQGAAVTIRDVTFLKFFIPVVTLIGVPIFFYFGFKGIIKRETLMLLSRRVQRSPTAGFSIHVTGTWAQILGVIYLIMGLGLACILLPVIYYLFF